MSEQIIAIEGRKPKRKAAESVVLIRPPHFQRATIKIVGTAPYVQNRFPEKVRLELEAKYEAGDAAKNKRRKEPKDWDAAYKQAIHTSDAGWYGIPASAMRKAIISACRLVNFKMTIAKLTIFVEADGFDAEDRSPLVKIIGKPRPFKSVGRTATGEPLVMVRPIWDSWSADMRIRWDADQFSADDVVNLVARVGAQVGIGEGRHDSKNSPGMGWGTFEVKS